MTAALAAIAIGLGVTRLADRTGLLASFYILQFQVAHETVRAALDVLLATSLLGLALFQFRPFSRKETAKPGPVESGASEDGIITIDESGTILAFNAGAERIFGYRAEEVIGTGFFRLAVPDQSPDITPDRIYEVIGLLRQHADGEERETMGRRKDGSCFHVGLRIREIDLGTRRLLTGTVRDISERKAVEAQLAVADVVLSESSEGVMVTDSNGAIQWVNATFTRISGYSAEEVVGRTPRILHSGMHDNAFFAHMWDRIRTTGSWSGEIWNRRKNGETHPCWLSIRSITDQFGLPVKYIGIVSDLSRHKRAEAMIRHLRNFDPLTDLPNRTLFLERLHDAVARAREAGRKVALAVISIDRFRTISETLGQERADTLLREIAGRLCAAVRNRDTVARLDGSDFCCALTDLADVEEARAIVAAIGDAFAASFALDGHEVFASASVGVSVFPDDGTEAGVLLQKAVLATGQAGNKGLAGAASTDSATPEHRVQRLRLETSLRKAVQRGEILLHYQPKVDARRGSIIGVEALARWNDEEHGFVPPDVFIPMAEEIGLIDAIGKSVLHQACGRARAWMAEGLLLPVSVNLSARQFRQPDLLKSIDEALEGTGLPPHLLELELTESAVMTDATTAVQTLRALKNRGVRLAIDDFGTGYSSLSYLKQFPIDTLKIDRSFIQDLAQNNASPEIVSAIVALGHSLKLSVTAEGVETEEQAMRLRALGCDSMQGYFYGRPQPAEALADLLRSGTTDPAP